RDHGRGEGSLHGGSICFVRGTSAPSVEVCLKVEGGGRLFPRGCRRGRCGSTGAGSRHGGGRDPTGVAPGQGARTLRWRLGLRAVPGVARQGATRDGEGAPAFGSVRGGGGGSPGRQSVRGARVRARNTSSSRGSTVARSPTRMPAAESAPSTS